MSVHAILENHIHTIEAMILQEDQRQRLNQLPPLTGAIKRTLRQAAIAELLIDLMQEVFSQEPACSPDEVRLYLQKPLAHLGNPKDVFVRSQDDLQAFQSQLEVNWERLQTLAQQVEQQLVGFKDKMHLEMDTVHALLKIPDLLPDQEESEKISQVVDEMDRVLERARVDPSLGEPNAIKRMAQEWEQLHTRFVGIRRRLSFDRLQIDYSFSKDTIAVIEHLTSGKALTLDELTPEAIGELQRFQQFCRQIVLRLTAQS
jgi:hypothetical protein